MPNTILNRLSNLEQATIQAEGAHYALHDLVAGILARTPEADTRALIQTLADSVSVHADKIGQIRLSGYIQELESMRDEVMVARDDARGLFARLKRTRS